MQEPGKTVFSIGHSNHSFEAFEALLAEHNIDVLIDVRSQPWSKYASQFNREPLAVCVDRGGRTYLFFGEELGGRPRGEDFYDSDGHVLYGKVAETPAFRAAIEQVERQAQKFRPALMCSEEDPRSCHRRLLVARVLASHGVHVLHIRGDGRIESEGQLQQQELAKRSQQSLFDDEMEEPWRSTQSVSQKRALRNSSAS